MWKLLAIFIFIPATFVLGFEMAKMHYEKSDIELQEDFKRYGQYDPTYINYTDDQMLRVCDKYNLVYDFEEGKCQ